MERAQDTLIPICQTDCTLIRKYLTFKYSGQLLAGDVSSTLCTAAGHRREICKLIANSGCWVSSTTGRPGRSRTTTNLFHSTIQYANAWTDLCPCLGSCSLANNLHRATLFNQYNQFYKLCSDSQMMS